MGTDDPRCARGLRVSYAITACPECVAIGAAEAWPAAVVGTEGATRRIVYPFRFELRVHADLAELWHRVTRPREERGGDRLAVEGLLGRVLDARCAHGAGGAHDGP